MSVRRPLGEVLSAHGIQFKTNNKDGRTWHNFKDAPCCGHNGYQCGVVEWQEGDRLRHAVKCQHPNDNPWGVGNPRYLDLLAKIGVPPDEPGDRRRGPDGMASRQTLEQRTRRLLQSTIALEWLLGRGINADTISRFHLGLAEPYTDKAGVTRSDALTYPVIDATGSPTKRFGYYAVPGVTRNPVDANGWMAGEVLPCFGGPIAGATTLLLVEGCKDLWRLSQSLQDWNVQGIALCTSSHGIGIPRAWLDPGFWSPFERVLIGTDMDGPGEDLALRIANLAPGARRVRIPSDGTGADGRAPKDWTDWLNGGHAAPATFTGLLDAAEVVSLPPVRALAASGGGASGSSDETGEFEFNPINVQSAFHECNLYYCAHVLSRRVTIDQRSGQPVLAEGVETVVVRSDRTRHHARAMPPLPGGGSRPVFRLLPDGAVLDRRPTVSEFCTWRWGSISEYLENKSSQRPLAALLSDVEGHLRAAVWLPHQEAYAALTAAVAVTYCQFIFDSVPLFLATGAAGSGKSQLGRIMHRLCANSVFVGQTSAATVARQVDAARGFMVLDDLESIAAKTKDSAVFNDLVQALKLSYNKSTGTKAWTDPKTMQTSMLTFYGIKLINNTRGVDEILGSRMIQIPTRVLTKFKLQALGGLPAPPAIDTDALRQQLHTWAFEEAARIAAAYSDMRATLDRSEEIVTPLRVVARLSGDGAFAARLEDAISGLVGKSIDPENPGDVVVTVAKRLVQRGFRKLCATHVRLEMGTEMDVTYAKESIGSIPEWARADWIGRELRSRGVVDPRADVERRRPAAGGNPLNVFPIEAEFVSEALNGVPGAPVVDPMSWCLTEAEGGCAGCRYLAAGCDLADRRLNRRQAGARRGSWP